MLVACRKQGTVFPPHLMNAITWFERCVSTRSPLKHGTIALARSEGLARVCWCFETSQVQGQWASALH